MFEKEETDKKEEKMETYQSDIYHRKWKIFSKININNHTCMSL